jgi:hypothetical protein
MYDVYHGEHSVDSPRASLVSLRDGRAKDDTGVQAVVPGPVGYTIGCVLIYLVHRMPFYGYRERLKYERYAVSRSTKRRAKG